MFLASWGGPGLLPPPSSVTFCQLMLIPRLSFRRSERKPEETSSNQSKNIARIANDALCRPLSIDQLIFMTSIQPWFDDKRFIREMSAMRHKSQDGRVLKNCFFCVAKHLLRGSTNQRWKNKTIKRKKYKLETGKYFVKLFQGGRVWSGLSKWGVILLLDINYVQYTCSYDSNWQVMGVESIIWWRGL